MSQEVEDLDVKIGYQLKHLQSVLRSRMDETLREVDLSTPQYVCLELLRRSPGASNSELARGAFVTRQTMNTLLRGLQERGLVARAEQADSGRSLPATLTLEGERALDSAVERISVIEVQLVEGLSKDQRDALSQSLDICIESLSTREH